MNKFERNIDPKNSIGVGIITKLPEWMKNSEYDYKNYIEVWKWALENEKNFIFPYIVSKNQKKWFNCMVKIGDYNNELLWISVESQNIHAVKAILTIPKLFRKETFNYNLGVSKINKTMFRGGLEVNLRETNFGVFINLARDSEEITNLLKNYTNA